MLNELPQNVPNIWNEKMQLYFVFQFEFGKQYFELQQIQKKQKFKSKKIKRFGFSYSKNIMPYFEAFYQVISSSINVLIYVQCSTW